MTKEKIGKGVHVHSEGYILNKRVATLVIGAFAFILAFGVNQLFVAIFNEHISPLDKSEAWFIYVIFAFIVAVIIINLLYSYLD